MVITIDGPSGAGKSTVSRRLASELGFAYLDTGALYRAVALAATVNGMEQEENEAVIAAWLTRVDIAAKPENGRFVVYLDDRNVEPFIRNEEIGGIASRLSAMAPVRGFLLELQRKAGQSGDLVAEGRDMGTVVFPEAEAKFFLVADDGERARRRYEELKPAQPELTLETVARELTVRDERDAGRSVAPLTPARDAFVIDSTKIGVDHVVAIMREQVKSAQSGD
jgi:cytidylate kinase